MGLIDYLKQMNNVLRLINVFLAYLSIIIWGVHHYSSIRYAQEYMKIKIDDYFDFDRFIRTFKWLQVVLSLLLCLTITRCFMLLRGGRGFINIYYTLYIPLTLIMWLIIGVIILIFILMRLQYMFFCQEIFRMKELIITIKMTYFISNIVLNYLNVIIFLLIRIVAMFSLRALFIIFFLHFSRIARAYKPKESDNFNFVLFFIERVKIMWNKKKK
jgi:hypothetical protein